MGLFQRVALASLLLLGIAGAATWTVNATGADFTGVQDAIGNATAGDTILVYGGTYGGSITVNKALTLRGIDAGAGMPVINGSGSGAVVTVSADGVTLDGFVVQNGNTGVNVTANNGVFVNNTVQHNRGADASGTGSTGSAGYGFYVRGSNGTFLNNTVQYNVGGQGGAGSGTGIPGGIGGGGYGFYINGSGGNSLARNMVLNNTGGTGGTGIPGYTWGQGGNGGYGYGIYLGASYGNTISNNLVLDNRGGNGGDTQCSGYGGSGAAAYGIYLSASDNNTLLSNTVQNGSSGAGSSACWGGGGVSTDYATYFDSSNGNLVYNNYLNSTNPIVTSSSANYFNATKTAGTSIIGGPYLGGNFWIKPDEMGFSQTCRDLDRDKICDKIYRIDAGNFDYLPLNLVSDETPPAAASGLRMTGQGYNEISVAWTDPATRDFSHVMLYVNGVFRENVSKGVQYYMAGGLESGTNYTISIRTVDLADNINESDVSQNLSTRVFGEDLVRVWGGNQYGQLGNGSSDGGVWPPLLQPLPQTVSALPNIIAINIGKYMYTHALALDSGGTVWVWGNNGDGGLGTGDTTDYYSPTRAQISNVTAIAAGEASTIALKSDGTVWAWGRDDYGQLGINVSDYDPHPTPEQVIGISDVISISAGRHHAAALRSDGTVWTWGRNGEGQLGINVSDYDPHPLPAEVIGISNVVAISLGYYHTVALKSDGTVWAWGSNGYGELGTGDITDYYYPVQVPGLSNVTAIAAKGDQSGTTFALKSDGTVWAWGSNYNGELGIGTSDYDPHPNPVWVEDVSNITKIAAGRKHALALGSDGALWAWGDNGYGQLGNSGVPDGSGDCWPAPDYVNVCMSALPVQVSGPEGIGYLSNVSAISGGQYNSIVLVRPTVVPNATAAANLTIYTDSDDTVSDLDGDVRLGRIAYHPTNGSTQYSFLNIRYANDSVSLRFFNASFTNSSTLTVQNATAGIAPSSKGLTYWNRAIDVAPAFNFTRYNITFYGANPSESVLKCFSDCGNPSSWTAVPGVWQGNTVTVELNDSDPVIAMGGSAYISVSMPSNFSATLGAPVASGAGFSIPVDPLQTYPMLSLMSLDGSYDFDFANVAPGYSSALSVAGVVPPIGPSVFGVDAWIAAINVSMDFNTSGYNVTFLGMQGKRAFKCASNCTEAASWTEVATQSALGGMLLALAPGDPVILIGSSFGEEGGATKVAAPEADFLLVAMVFALAVFVFAGIAGRKQPA